MTDLLAEVQEDLQYEKSLNFVRQYGRLALVVMSVVVISIACKMWWHSYQANKIYKEGGMFIVATMKMRANKLDDAMTNFAELSKKGSTIYSTIAGLNLASFNQSKRNYLEAKENYQQIINQKHSNGVLDDYSNLMFLKAELSEPTSNKEELLKTLKNINSKTNSLSTSTIELQAALEIELGKTEEAQETITKVNSEKNAPYSIKKRLSQLEELIS